MGFLVLGGLLGLWLLLAKAKPQQLPAAQGPSTRSRSARALDEPVTNRDGSMLGVVRGADGKAIEGARVCATTVGSEVFWVPALTCATTNREGRYGITPLGSTVYVVSAVADGFRPASALDGRDISLGPGEVKAGVDVILVRGGARLSGHVVDATGGPVSGAKVRVLRRTVPHETTITASGTDGSFAVWTDAGPVTVLAEAAQYAPARIAHVAPSRDLVIRLTPGSTVSGRVVAEHTGDPVGGVRVRAVWPGTWDDPTQPSATSDSGGAFEIRGLEPGRYGLVGQGIGWRGEVTTPIEVGLAKVVDGVTLTVSSAAVVAGRVVRRGSGEPCSRGSVTLGPSSGNGPRLRGPNVPVIVGNLEAGGTVRFSAVPAGSYLVDVQCADALLAEGPTTLEVGPGDIDGLVWKVDPGARIVARAVDGAGEPAANVRLLLREGPPQDNASKDGSDRGPPPLRSFLTGADGAFELTGLAPSMYTIEPDFGFKGQPVPVDARTAAKVEATVHLEGRGWIVVTVRTPEGLGVDQVEVKAALAGEAATPLLPERNGKQGMSGAGASRILSSRAGFVGTGMGDGRFQIGPLDEGSYRVTASDGMNPPTAPSDWSQGPVRVGVGIARAAIVLRRGGFLAGRVVDSAAQPLPDLWVTADCSETPGASGHRAFPRIPLPSGASSRTVSDVEGRFRIDGVASDARCTLRAEQPGGGGMGFAQGARSGDDIVITVADVGSLSGTATLPDGTPVDRFQLSVRAPEGVTRSEIVTAVNGRWSLSHVVPGRMQLTAFHPSLGAARAQVELTPGQQRDGIELRFQPPPSQLSAMGPGERQP